jgi:hypothetical protein
VDKIQADIAASQLKSLKKQIEGTDWLTICVISNIEDYQKHVENFMKSIPKGYRVFWAVNGIGNGFERSDQKNNLTVFEHGLQKFDFSTCRNRLLEEVKTDWVLFLDADERLLYNPLQFEAISNLGKDFGGAFINIVGNDHNQNYYRTKLIRFMRKEVRYSRRVHEQVAPSIEKLGLKTAVTNVTAEHVGYRDIGFSIGKMERNISLMIEDLYEDMNEGDLFGKDGKLHLLHMVNHLEGMKENGYFDGIYTK